MSNTLAETRPYGLAGQDWVSPLEDFANLGDTLDDLHRFKRKHPCFWPVGVLKPTAERPLFLGLSDELHPLVIDMRNLLREFWRGNRDASITQVLLGLNTDLFDYKFFGRTAPPLSRMVSDAALAALKGLNVKNEDIDRTQVVPDERTGGFRLVSINWFPWAVYDLFRASWRARICARCSRYFVADRPPQLYCSTKCSGSAKSARSKKWWREDGNKWRRKQKAKRKPRAKEGTSAKTKER